MMSQVHVHERIIVKAMMVCQKQDANHARFRHLQLHGPFQRIPKSARLERAQQNYRFQKLSGVPRHPRLARSPPLAGVASHQALTAALTMQIEHNSKKIKNLINHT